jgi:hypothetical protein
MVVVGLGLLLLDLWVKFYYKKTMNDGALWLDLQFAVWEAKANVLLDFY